MEDTGHCPSPLKVVRFSSGEEEELKMCRHKRMDHWAEYTLTGLCGGSEKRTQTSVA